MLFLVGCKKDDVITPESKIEQLRNQVSNWYNLSTKEVLIDPDASTKRIASNSLNTQTSTDYSILLIDSLNFKKSYINFDSLSLTGLTVPMRTNQNTGEYVQLTTLSNKKKTKGYFVRSIPDENWYKKLGLKSDFSKMSGKIFVYNLKGKLISKAILVDGLLAGNVSQHQQASSENIKSNSWGYDENGLFSVTVYGYRRHNSWSDLIALAIFDSGNDLGISLGNSYVPFNPFDPSYYYGSATGGGAIVGYGSDPDLNPLNYPENVEILLFETDYRSRMSVEELEIFDTMDRTKQLQYLYNAKLASEWAESRFPNTVHNGNGDAFRHAFFSGMNVKILGLSLTKQLADAHELNPSPLLEIQMDLFNNQVGRDQYLHLKGLGLEGHFFKEMLLISLLQKIQNGDLRKINPLDASGNVINGVSVLIPTN